MIAGLKAMPQSFARRLAIGVFELFGYHLGIRKFVAQRQLSRVFPDMSIGRQRKVLRSMYRKMALGALESYVIADSQLIETTSVSGRENVVEALSSGRGAILLTAHFGSWEAARILPALGIPLSVIAKKQRNRLFNDYTDRVRQKQGAQVIDMKKGLRAIMERLEQNELVAILADQNAGARGLVTDFLGYPASHWKGAAKLSLRKKIPILPAFALRKDDDLLEIVFETPIYHPEWEDNEENCVKLIAEGNSIIETYIRRYPDQWFWVHKRWKYAYDMFSE